MLPKLDHLWDASPAKSFEQNMVAFSSKFDSSEESHWSVSTLLTVLKKYRVEIFHGDPTENGSSLFYVRATSGYKLPNLQLFGTQINRSIDWTSTVLYYIISMFLQHRLASLDLG